MPTQNFIIIFTGKSIHIFWMNAAFVKNEIILHDGDRYADNGKG